MDLLLLHLVPPDSTSENLLVYGAYEVTHVQINCSIICFLVRAKYRHRFKYGRFLMLFSRTSWNKIRFNSF